MGCLSCLNCSGLREKNHQFLEVSKELTELREHQGELSKAIFFGSGILRGWIRWMGSEYVGVVAWGCFFVPIAFLFFCYCSKIVLFFVKEMFFAIEVSNKFSQVWK